MKLSIFCLKPRSFCLATFIIAMIAFAVPNALAEPSLNTDPSARTWLPVPVSAKPADDAATAATDAFLQTLSGRIRPLICWYDGNRLSASRPLTNRNVTGFNSAWSCETRFLPSGNSAGDLEMHFKVTAGEVKHAGVAVAFDFTNWSIDNYILVPAQLYGGNRFRILPIAYPPYIHDAKNRPLDMPITTANILHLSQDGSAAKVEMNTGNVATPMLSFFNPTLKRAFILLAEQGTRFGNNGLFVQEDAGPATSSKRMTFVVSAPGVREQRYTMCSRESTNDRGTAWKAGDELTLKFKIYVFTAPDMGAFYERVFDVRKALSGANTYANVTPYSTAADLILAHHDADKWYEKGDLGFYSNHPGSESPFSYQIGWNGVPIYGFSSLIAETPGRLRRVCLSLDNMLFKAQGKSGLYYAMNRNGEILGDTFSEMSERRSVAMVRRSMDALYFGLQSLELMKQRGHSDLIKPEWEKSLRACADGLVKVWKDYGQFGQFIDVDTGKMEINGSTAGSSAGQGLALASHYFNNPGYLAVAEESMKMYYQRDFLKGYAGGGPAEILQAPDSESTSNMVESCIALYDITGRSEWLDRAKFAAHMLSTWMVSYDYRFPKGADMERANIHAAGSIFASSQNNHSAPGYYILSGDFLLKLFRATGDRRYAEMYKDQSHNVIQYVGAPHNPFRQESGFATERVQLSDWEGGDIGSGGHGDSNMAWETLAALTCLENPGIYLHTDDDTFLVLDHIEAQAVSRGETGVTIKIFNPTQYDARVSVLGETAARSRKPLGWGAYDRWPKVAVKARDTVTVRLDMEGKQLDEKK